MQNEQNPRVFVIQEGRGDYTPAEEFGTVHFVTTGELTKFEDSKQNDEVMHDIRRMLAGYIPGVDFIVPAGNPALVSLVMMSLSGVAHNILKWDGRQSRYIPYNLKPVAYSPKQ